MDTSEFKENTVQGGSDHALVSLGDALLQVAGEMDVAALPHTLP